MGAGAMTLIVTAGITYAYGAGYYFGYKAGLRAAQAAALAAKQNSNNEDIYALVPCHNVGG